MISYLNLHKSFEEKRERSSLTFAANKKGPRILLAGPTDSGKTTLSKSKNVPFVTMWISIIQFCMLIQ